NEYIKKILYRPFDERYIFYHQAIIERMRPEVMRHMLEENIGLICNRQIKTNTIKQFWISDLIVDLHILETAHASTQRVKNQISNQRFSKSLNPFMGRSLHLRIFYTISMRYFTVTYTEKLMQSF
ncbi:MAG: type ISP restriction/modification enzyme, partial [Candidatus Helarchaeota archaeon]